MSKQQTILSVVPESEVALSPARQKLVEAYSRREAANAQFAESTKQHRRVENLISDPKPFEDRIGQLEAEHAILIEQWSLTAGENAEPPKLPHAITIEELKAEHARAEAIATGAKTALMRLNADLQSCQRDAAAAVEGIRSAADQVLLEVADDIAKMLAPLEQRAALLRLALKSLQQHFLFEGARGRSVGNLSNAVSALVPRSHEPPPPLDKLMGRWSSLASRLFTEPESQLEL